MAEGLCHSIVMELSKIGEGLYTSLFIKELMKVMYCAPRSLRKMNPASGLRSSHAILKAAVMSCVLFFGETL